MRLLDPIQRPKQGIALPMIATIGVAVLLLTACSTGDTISADDATAETARGEGAGDSTEAVLHPDVVSVAATRDDDGTWTFDVTLSSPYDSAERYADAWRVVGPDGTVYGERILTHDHANEQPFTRSQSGIVIPDGVSEVTVEGRDQISGWGGDTMSYSLES